MKLSATSTHWNPEQYLKFSDHRLRPGLELLERIPLATPTLIYDLGCGTGKLTRLLAERWPEATIIGLDHSQEMLEKADKEVEKEDQMAERKVVVNSSSSNHNKELKSVE